MRVLVTGASGFIGSHVTEDLINAGHTVLCLVLPEDNLWRLKDVLDRLELLKCDLKRVVDIRSRFRDWRPEVCIHLAWYAEPGKYLHSLENLASLQGSLDLLQELYTSGCEYFVGAGTCAEYEFKPNLLYETDPAIPETLYAAAKLSFKMMAEQIALQHGRQFAWGRIFYLYGPREDPRRLIPGAIMKLAGGQAFPASPGEQVRDFLHVHDVAHAFVRMAEQKAPGTYNICSAQPVSLRAFLNVVGELIGHPELLSYGMLPYRDWEPMYVCGNNDRIKSIGWAPKFDMRSGLQDMIAWWKTADGAKRQ